MTSNILSRLTNRKSTNDLIEPIPSKEDINEIIQYATTVPDHGRLSPYSFHFSLVIHDKNSEKHSLNQQKNKIRNLVNP